MPRTMIRRAIVIPVGFGVRGQPEASRYVPAELAKMSKQFFHKFLLNDTFAPAERFNPKLTLSTVDRNMHGG